jgi:hypothetical protein
MLLRRVTKHVKDQNWFAVGIDFAIVVVGVFIGLQVANWNERRAIAITDAELIGRLSNDLQGMRKDYAQNEPIVRRIHDGWINTFRALENCTVTPDHRPYINYALAQYQRSFGLAIQQSALDEMKSVGAFSRIGNVELQNQISTLYSMLEIQVAAENTGRINQLAAGRIMWKSIAFSFASDEPGKEDYDSWGTAAFSPLSHCDNLELRGAVWEMVDTHRDWLSIRSAYDERMMSILSQLETLK